MAAVEAALSSQEKLLACVTVRPDRADDTDARSRRSLRRRHARND